jgi:hypothetical protein
VRAVAVLSAVALLATACSKAPSEPVSGPGGSPGSGGAQQELSIWLTGYSWQHNTLPGSSIVGEPVLHKQAGGTGTFADPITVASTGHAGNQEWEPGTKFYLPTVPRYVIVEDSGAAKAPKTHLDMSSGGRDGTKDDVNTCMESSLAGSRRR